MLETYKRSQRAAKQSAISAEAIFNKWNTRPRAVKMSLEKFRYQHCITE